MPTQREGRPRLGRTWPGGFQVNPSFSPMSAIDTLDSRGRPTLLERPCPIVAACDRGWPPAHRPVAARRSSCETTMRTGTRGWACSSRLPTSMFVGLVGEGALRADNAVLPSSSAGREARRHVPGLVRARGVTQHMVATRHELRGPNRQPEGRVGSSRARTRRCWSTLDVTVGPFTSALRIDSPVVDDDQGPTLRPGPGGV